jgi:hypothetical protein
VGLVQYLGWTGGSGPVSGVDGWEWSSIWEPGGSGPVLGVAGWVQIWTHPIFQYSKTC